MRVAILIAELVRQGGGERQALYLARELCELGHRVVVYTTEHLRRSCYPDLSAGLEIVSVGRHPLRGRAVPLPEKVALYLEMRRLAQAVATSFDVLNPHAWPAHLAAVWAAKLAPPPAPPVVWMCNDYMWGAWLAETQGSWVGSRWGRRTVRRMFYRHDLGSVRLISRLVVLSEQARSEVEAGYGIRADIVRSGTDLFRLRRPDIDSQVIRQRYKISDNAFLLMFLGILMPHRRLEDALLAVARVVGAGGDLHFLIAGSLSYDESYSATLQEQVRTLGLERHVTFADAVSEEELPSFYHACDAFVFPNEGQTWGLAVTEAMACGKPVIVSTGAGVREVLTDAQTALLVPPRRPDLIANQVRRLMDDRGFAASVAKQGSELVASTLTWHRYALNMVDIFRATLDEWHPKGLNDRPSSWNGNQQVCQPELSEKTRAALYRRR